MAAARLKFLSVALAQLEQHGITRRLTSAEPVEAIGIRAAAAHPG
jgi:hypothetical protein